MIKKFKFETLFYIFFMIQPITGMYRTFFGDNLKVAGFSLFEMFNTFCILGFAVFVIYQLKQKKKALYLLGYLILLGGYFLLHSYNVGKFDTNVMDRDMYGLIKESYYIFRVYGLPIILLFTCIYAQFKKDFILKVICDVAFFTSLVIVITNILNLSLCTYKVEFHDYVIQGNVFDWFTLSGREEMDYFTSIGWFESGNEISGLLMISLPIITYQAMNCRSIKKFVRLSVCMLAMMMIGTKTSVLGSIAVFVVVAIMMLVHFGLKKQFVVLKKCGILVLCFLCVWGILFYNSPFLRDLYPRVDELGTVEEVEQEEEKKETTQIQLIDASEADRVHALTYMKNAYWNHYVMAQYMELYPIENDLPYWIEVFNRNPAINMNYRFFKTQMVSRIIERNENPLDKFVGIGVLMEINTEQDYVYQYYMFGIIGVILLLGCYITIFVKGGLAFLLRSKLRWNVEYMSYLASLAIALALPYVSGHMFGVTIVMFTLVMVCTLVWKPMEKE